MRRGAILIVTAFALAGCGDDKPDFEPFTMQGTYTLDSKYATTVGSSQQCQTATNVRSPLQVGTEVLVRDASGIIVGRASISTAYSQPNGSCRLRFYPEITADSDFYSIAIGASDPVTVGRDAARLPVQLSTK